MDTIQLNLDVLEARLKDIDDVENLRMLVALLIAEDRELRKRLGCPNGLKLVAVGNEGEYVRWETGEPL